MSEHSVTVTGACLATSGMPFTFDGNSYYQIYDQQKVSPESLSRGWIWFLWCPNLPHRSSPCTIEQSVNFATMGKICQDTKHLLSWDYNEKGSKYLWIGIWWLTWDSAGSRLEDRLAIAFASPIVFVIMRPGHWSISIISHYLISKGVNMMCLMLVLELSATRYQRKEKLEIKEKRDVGDCRDERWS